MHLNQLKLENICYIKFKSTFKTYQNLLAYLDIYDIACVDNVLFAQHNLIVNSGQTFNVIIPIW